MANTLFNSMRKFNLHNFKPKNIDQDESVGEFFKKNTIDDYGSIPEPSCMDFDDDRKILIIGTKKGAIKVYGRPGICYSGMLANQEEIWNIKYIPGTNFFVVLTSANTLSLWNVSHSSNQLINVDTIANIKEIVTTSTEKLNQSDPNNNDEDSITKNITAIAVIDITSSVVMGNGEGSLIQVKLELLKMKKNPDLKVLKVDKSFWQTPTSKDFISSSRIKKKLPTGSQKTIKFGAIIHISARPGSRKQILIGYNTGHSIIYDVPKDSIVYFMPTKVPILDLSWYPPEPVSQDNFLVPSHVTKPQYHLSDKFFSVHEDGAIILWTLPVDNISLLAVDSGPIFPYGNKRCMAITKIFWRKTTRGESVIIFSGGLPRADYMTKSTITVMTEDCVNLSKPIAESQHIVFDLTSRLIDMHTIDDHENNCVKYLLVLTEEEFFVIDLTSKGWPMFEHQPYLNCIHPSPITAYHFISDVSSDWFWKISSINSEKSSQPSFENWPITGTFSEINDAKTDIWLDDLLITGHGDGAIVFWKLGRGGCIWKLLTIKSSVLFKIGDDVGGGYYRDDEDEDVPFRKIGTFDPCCDDNRLAIQLLHFNGNNLLIGGFGGQVILWSWLDKSVDKQFVEVDLTTHLSGFKWKGCKPLEIAEPKQNEQYQQTSFRPLMIVNIYPPSQVTALDITEQKYIDTTFVACGTLHGIIVIYCQTRPKCETMVLTTHCTVPFSSAATQEAALGEGWARRRTRELKKSLRESFRRLRRRSTKRMDHPSVRRGVSLNPEDQKVKVELVENEVNFEERIVEDRPKETGNFGLIRSLKIYISPYLKKPPITPDDPYINIFAGTSGGCLMWFQSVVPINLRSLPDAKLRIVKQYQFQHRAPVLHLNLIDQDGQVLNDKNQNQTGFSKKSDQLLVVTEEQIRVYVLPVFHLKSKLRATATDGFRLKSGSIIALNDDKMQNKLNKEVLLCVTNNGGQFSLLNPFNLKRKDVVQFVDKTDLMALNFMTLAVCCKLDVCDTNSCLTTSLSPYGLYYSGHGQVTLFQIVSKSKKL